LQWQAGGDPARSEQPDIILMEMSLSLLDGKPPCRPTRVWAMTGEIDR
jgi:hypothetical protein